jgi:hypothetical protein
MGCTRPYGPLTHIYTLTKTMAEVTALLAKRRNSNVKSNKPEEMFWYAYAPCASESHDTGCTLGMDVKMLVQSFKSISYRKEKHLPQESLRKLWYLID